MKGGITITVNEDNGFVIHLVSGSLFTTITTIWAHIWTIKGVSLITVFICLYLWSIAELPVRYEPIQKV